MSSPQALQERKNVDEHLAATVANISNGSYSRAVELAENEDLRYDRERILDFLRSCIYAEDRSQNGTY